MRAPAVLLAIPLTVGCALGLLIARARRGALWALSRRRVRRMRGRGRALLALIGCVERRSRRNARAALESTVCLVVGGIRRRPVVWASTRRSAPIGRRSSSGSLRSDPGGAPGRASGQPARGRRADRDRCLAGRRCPRDRTVSRSAARAAARADSRFTADRMRDARRRAAVGRRHAGARRDGAVAQPAAPCASPPSLREPTTYRNPGVPDEQRALARRGIALVGSVKSAAMVEVVGARVAPRRVGVGVQGVGQVGAFGARSRRGARDRPGSPPRSRSATARAWRRTTRNGCRRRAPITSSRSRAGTSRF